MSDTLQTGNMNPVNPDIAKNMKFSGIMYIITGALTCLGIITAIIGVPMIIAGLRAKDAGEKLEGYMATGDSVAFDGYMSNIGDHFKMLKIYFIIYIIATVLGIIFYASFIGMIVSGALGGLDGGY
ncbi:MAG: hypothetical protein Kapaf2KO_20860 [Candidatus Kapaibacteriales bacterium]